MFTWVSASEGDRFAQVIRGVTAKVKALGPAGKLKKKIG
jgi:coenzyme F420-reducing hydrogenase delta subunit